MWRSLLLALAVSCFAGCATGLPAGAHMAMPPASPPIPPSEPPPDASPAEPQSPPEADGGTPDLDSETLSSSERHRVVELARSFLGKKKIVVDHHRFPNDCTGLVRAVYSQLGFQLLADAHPGDNAVTAIWRYARRHGRIFEGGHPLPGDLVFFRDTYDRNRDGRIDDGLTHVAIVEGQRPDGTVSIIHRVSHGVRRYRMNLRHRDLHRDPRSGKVINDYLRVSRGADLLTGQLFAGYAVLIDPHPAKAPLPVAVR